jgi:hypothetical protein
MNKARVGEPARGFILNNLFLREKLLVDSYPSIEDARVMTLDPSVCRTPGKTGVLNGTKECRSMCDAKAQNPACGGVLCYGFE